MSIETPSDQEADPLVDTEKGIVRYRGQVISGPPKQILRRLHELGWPGNEILGYREVKPEKRAITNTRKISLVVFILSPLFF